MRVRRSLKPVGEYTTGNCVGKSAMDRHALKWMPMALPIKVCVVCSEEFELRPDKPGFANRCPACSEPEAAAPAAKRPMDAVERKAAKEADEARRKAIRDLLYRKES
jgi:hypothetical protein